MNNEQILNNVKEDMKRISFNGKVKLSYSLKNGRIIIGPDPISLSDFLIEKLYNDDLMDFIESTGTPEKVLTCHLKGKSGCIHVGGLAIEKMGLVELASTMMKSIEVATKENDLPEYYANNETIKQILEWE